MSEVRLSGLASGIDTNSLIQQLMQVERRPITLLQGNIGKNNRALEALRNLNTKFQALEAAAKKVQDLTNFAPDANASTGTSNSGRSAEVASSGIIGVGALPNTAALGEYLVNVESLARRNVITGTPASVTGATGEITALGAGDQLRFTDTSGGSFDVSLGDDWTLQQIVTAVNASATAPMTAGIANNQLVFTAKNVGAAFNYSVSVYNGGALAETATTALGLPNASAVVGTDAKITVTPPEGSPTTYTNASATPGTSSSNSISSTNAGTLAGGGPGTALGFNLFANAIGETSFTISERAGANSSSAADANTPVGVIRDMVNKYNDVVRQLKADTAYNPTTRTGGPLMGDPSISRVLTELNRALTLPFTQNNATAYPTEDSALNLPTQNGITGDFAVHNNRGFQNYAQLGMRVERDGTVSLDDAKLRTALTDNPNDVRRLLAFEDFALDGARQISQGGTNTTWGDGIATRLRAFANQSSSPLSFYNGVLPNGQRAQGAVLSRISAIERQNTTFSENIQRQERRLVQRERLLRLQFERMEKTRSNLKSQGNYLQGQFANAAGNGQQ
jgi:flagellar hook-associated protein 2